MTAARTILIIDSDRDVAEGIAIRLRGAGFRTVWTTTAALRPPSSPSTTVPI